MNAFMQDDSKSLSSYWVSDGDMILVQKKFVNLTRTQQPPTTQAPAGRGGA